MLLGGFLVFQLDDLNLASVTISPGSYFRDLVVNSLVSPILTVLVASGGHRFYQLNKYGAGQVG